MKLAQFTWVSAMACISLLIPKTRPRGRQRSGLRAEMARGAAPVFPCYFQKRDRSVAPASVQATKARTASACISLLIRGKRLLARGATRSLRIPAGAQGTKSDRHCKSLQIVADMHAAALDPSSGTQGFLPREIAAFA